MCSLLQRYIYDYCSFEGSRFQLNTFHLLLNSISIFLKSGVKSSVRISRGVSADANDGLDPYHKALLDNCPSLFMIYYLTFSEGKS